MLRALANRVLEFSNGTDTVKTNIGFNELPDWVAETPFYKMAVVGGELRPFEGSSPKESEEMIKAKETLEELQRQHAELQEKIEATESKGKDKIQALKDEIAELEAQAEALRDSQSKGNNNNKR